MLLTRSIRGVVVEANKAQHTNTVGVKETGQQDRES